jgi:predicted alpha/beta hydrolase family esterase
MKTIVFLSGFSIPKLLAKSSLFFDETMWKGYHTVFYSSKTPISNEIVEKELDNLYDLISSFSQSIVVGHSLGAWWAAHLANRHGNKITKLILWTPLCDTTVYSSLFTVDGAKYNPTNNKNVHNYGPHKTSVVYADNDLIVPYNMHAKPLISHFNANSYILNGGHAYQTNHSLGLEYIKDWIEI